MYLGELSRDFRASGSGMSALFHRTSARLAMLAVTGGVVLVAFAPALFRLVFGAEWTVSGEYARALAVALVAQMVAAPLSQTLVVLGKQGQQLAWDAGRLVVTAGTVAICAALDLPAITAMWSLSAALAASYATAWWMAHRAVGLADRVE